jgi:uncharacterized protein involved in tolerance to divalent cations
MFVTAPSVEEARRIAQSLLERRLVACVNMVPQVQSMYVWEGKVESSQEVLMMIKVPHYFCLMLSVRATLLLADARMSRNILSCCCGGVPEPLT